MKSRETFRLSTITGGAVLILYVVYFGVLSVLVLPLKLSKTISGGASLSVLAVALGSASWYLFRKLQVTHFNRREARAIAIAFVVCFPISLCIALGFYVIPIVIAGALVPAHGVGFLILFFSGTALVSAFLTILGCALGLWIVRRTEKAESHDQRAQVDNAT